MEMVDKTYHDLLACIILSSGPGPFEIFPLRECRANKNISTKVKKNHLHGLLFKLGILKQTKIKISFKEDKLKSVVCILNTSFNHSPIFEATNQKPYNQYKRFYIEVRSLGKYKYQKLDDSDIGTLDAARADYLAACSTTMTRVKMSKPGTGEEADEEKRRREEEDQHKNEQRRMQGSEEDHKEKAILHIMRNTSKIIGGKEVSFQIPRNFSIVKNYDKKKCLENEIRLKEELDTFREENAKLRDEIKSKRSCQDQIIMNLNHDILSLHENIMKLHQKITNLQKEIRNNETKCTIGGIILDIQSRFKNSGKLCHPGSIEGKRLYGLALEQIPAVSAKYLQMAIPVFISAFLTDIGLSDFFDLEMIPTITPSDKTLEEIILLSHEFVSYKTATYINKGGVTSMTHDKGERNGLGRLIRLCAFYNRKNYLEPLFHDGIISLRVDADGVKADDKSISQHLHNTFKRCLPYKDEDKVIQISSFTTDHGGGGGTKESCANAFARTFGMMFSVWYVVTCTLHGHSKPLEKAWLKAFGEFGTDRKTSSQFVFQCWYIQSKLNKQNNFRLMWKKLTGKDWVGPLLKRPILSRWGYPLGTCSKVFYEYHDWVLFLKEIYHGETTTSEIGKAVAMAVKIGINPQTKCQLCFLSTFGEIFWTPMYNWIRRNDGLTKLEGHSCHEVLIQVFLFSEELVKIENGNWKNHPAFAECKVLTEALLDEEEHNNVWSPRKATMQRYSIFILEYRKAFEADSGFNRWKTKLFSFALGSSNHVAATILAQEILRCKRNISNDAVIIPTDPNNIIASIPNNSISPKGNHTEFKYADFRRYIQEKCTINVIDDALICKHEKGIEALACGACLWDETINDESIKNLRSDIEDVVLTAKHHAQQAEAGVQEVSHCSQNNKSEAVSSALVAARSFDNQWITMELAKELQTCEKRANQHMTSGVNISERQHRSDDSNRLSHERQKTGQSFRSQPQPSSRRSRLIIRCARVHPWSEEVYKKMKKQVQLRKKEADDCIKAKTIRKRQYEEAFDRRTAENNDRLAGTRGGKGRDANQLKMDAHEKLVDETNEIRISEFRRKYQMAAIIKEIVHREIPMNKSTHLEHIAAIHAQQEEAVAALTRQLKTVTRIKERLMQVLDTNDKNFRFVPKTFVASEFLEER